MSLDLEAIVEAAAERVARRLEDRVVARVQALIDKRLGERWETRSELAQRLSLSVDTIDRRAAMPGGGIELRRVGRRCLVRLLERPTEDEIAAEARAR